MLVAFSVAPLGTGESVTQAVADAVRVVRESGLPNRTDAMFTTIEGEWDEVMDVVKRAPAVPARPLGRAHRQGGPRGGRARARLTWSGPGRTGRAPTTRTGDEGRTAPNRAGGAESCRTTRSTG